MAVLPTEIEGIKNRRDNKEVDCKGGLEILEKASIHSCQKT